MAYVLYKHDRAILHHSTIQLTENPVEFSIRACRNRSDLQSICATDNDGQTLCWVPVDDNNRLLVKAERVSSDSAEACAFTLSRISSSIPPP